MITAPTIELSADVRELIQVTALLHFNEALGYDLDPAASYSRSQLDRMIEVAVSRGRPDIADTIRQLTPRAIIQ